MCYCSEKHSTVLNNQEDNDINVYQILYFILDLLDATLTQPYFTAKKIMAW
jgi:hypothetical protein